MERYCPRSPSLGARSRRSRRGGAAHDEPQIQMERGRDEEQKAHLRVAHVPVVPHEPERDGRGQQRHGVRCALCSATDSL